MSEYMKRCDIAITAAGSTVYELCACGIPSITYTFADNQLMIAQTVSEMGLLPWVGDLRKDTKFCMNNIIAEIEHLKSDRKERSRQSKEMMGLTDGRGCVRIAERIREYCGF